MRATRLTEIRTQYKFIRNAHTCIDLYAPSPFARGEGRRYRGAPIEPAAGSPGILS